MPFKLTEEQRSKIAEIVGADNIQHIRDEEQFLETENARATAVTTVTKLQGDLDGLKTIKTQHDQNLIELNQLREEKTKKTPVDVQQELESLRNSLNSEHQAQLQSLTSDLKFWQGETERALKTEKIRTEAAKLNFEDAEDAVLRLTNQVKVEVIELGGVKQAVPIVIDPTTGTKRYNNAAQQMQVDELVAQLAKEKNHLIKKTLRQGAGAQGSEGAAGETGQDRIASLNKQYDEFKAKGDMQGMMRVERLKTELLNASRK
jgi:hypothetical protein